MACEASMIDGECPQPDSCEECIDACTSCGDEAHGGQCDGGCDRPLCQFCNVGDVMNPTCESCDEREKNGENE